MSHRPHDGTHASVQAIIAEGGTGEGLDQELSASGFQHQHQQVSCLPQVTSTRHQQISCLPQAVHPQPRKLHFGSQIFLMTRSLRWLLQQQDSLLALRPVRRA